MNVIQRHKISILISVSVLLLLTMLSYPFAYDQSVFAVGGESILKNGAIPGHDFLDTKPPVIFYIYSIALWIFGHHQWSIRAFDIAYHCFSLLYFYFILNRVFKNKFESISIISVYTLLYVSSGYWMTAQAESFALLPFIVILDLTIRFESASISKTTILLYSSLIALSLLVLILLKYTLGFVFLGLIGYFLSSSKKKIVDRIKFLGAISCSCFILLGIYILYLKSIGSLDDTLLGMQWVSNYASIDPLFNFQTIRNQIFLGFPQAFISAFTPLIFISFFFGIWFRNKNDSVDTSQKYSFNYKNTFFLIALWQCSLGLLSVLLERKNFAYTYSRIFWVSSPFIFIGIRTFWEIIPEFWRENRNSFAKKFLLLLIVFISLFFSPLPRLISQSLSWSLISLTNNEEAKLDRLSADTYSASREIASLTSSLDIELNKSDEILFWGNMVEVYFQLNKLPTTLCLTNTPLVTPWTPKSWKEKFLQQLNNSHPRVIISEVGDERPRINGTSKDSFQMILDWDAFHNYLKENYHEGKGSTHFKVFWRNI